MKSPCSVVGTQWTGWRGGLPALLETLDDGTNEATLEGVLVVAQRWMRPKLCQCPYLDAIGLDSNEAASRMG